MKKTFLIAGLMLSASLLPQDTRAQEIDKRIEGAKQCTRNLARYERQYGIPMHLLSAISATESGRYHDGLKLALPWPWTINVEGQGHYFDNKQEAIAAVRKFQAQGARSIDIGCMQVNLIHHANAFANLEEAFDPEKNVAYGASFLRSLYQESGSWKKASAHYHSKTPTRGTEYSSRVYDRWTNIINRLRDAKKAIPETTVAALAEKELPAPPVQLVMKEEAAPTPRTIAVRSATQPSQKSITVTDVGMPSRSRDNGVLVIRPKITVVDDASSPMPIKVASAEAAPIPTLAPVAAPSFAGDAARVIHVADSKAAQPAGGPRFIFDN